MKKLLMLPLLLMAACSMPSTGQERYFATVSFVKGTSQIVEIYVDACKTFPEAHSCYKKFPAISTGATITKAALKEATRAFLNKDENADEAYAAADDAAMSMRNLLRD